MSGITDLTDDDITNFLGSLDLHQTYMKSFWQVYLDTSQDQATRDAAKKNVTDALAVIASTLNTLEASLALQFPTTPLSDTEIIKYGIMSEEEVAAAS